jgi:hypothetical protein
MPSKKRTAANLGHWAQPGVRRKDCTLHWVILTQSLQSRKKKTQHQPAADVPLPESPELPDTHPVDDEEPVLDSASSIDLGTVSTLSVDDDLLPPKGSIARWLGSSCDKLQKLFDNPSTAEPNSRARGKYAVKGVEEPALRTKQLHAKIKRDHEQKFGVSPMLKFLKAKLPHAIDVDKPDETELESTAFDGEDFAPEHPGATSQYRLQAVRDIVNNGTADDIEQARDSLWAGPWATWVTLDAGGEDYGLGRPGELEVEHAQAPNRAAASAPLLGRPSVSFTSELEPRPTRPVVPRVACDARLPGGHGCVGDSNEQLPMHLATWGVSSPFVTTRAREELTLGDGAEMLHASRGETHHLLRDALDES